MHDSTEDIEATTQLDIALTRANEVQEFTDPRSAIARFSSAF